MKIAVIGAGLGGLTFGACAARDGHEVVLIDKNREPGGVLALARQDGFSFEQGPLILTDLLPEEPVGALLESLGIRLETVRDFAYQFESPELIHYYDSDTFVVEPFLEPQVAVLKFRGV